MLDGDGGIKKLAGFVLPVIAPVKPVKMEPAAATAVTWTGLPEV